VAGEKDVRIVSSVGEPVPMPEGNIAELFLEAVEGHGKAEALKSKRAGAWQALSHEHVYEDVKRAAFGLEALGFNAYTVRLNDRRILTSLAAAAGAAHCEMDVLIAIDKLDKIGVTGVSEELRAKGLADDAIARLWDSLRVPGDIEGALASLEDKLDARGTAGVASLREVLEAADPLGVPVSRIRIDPSLARGLDYYTGPVFEAEVVEPAVGSICGGGRYDHLIGMFSGRDIPAVGVSLGLERIVTVMEALGMLPETEYRSGTTILEQGALLFLYTDGITEAMDPAEEFFGEDTLEECLKTSADLSPEEILATVQSRVQKHLTDAPQDDDMTMIAIKRPVG